METAEIIDPGFSVADAENVSLRTIPSGLEISFTDWRECAVRVLFVDAISHSWDLLDWNFVEGERFDSTHIIHNSEWLRKHIAQNAINERQGYNHYRLNFNASGTLQVLARGISIENAEQVGGCDGEKPAS